MPLVLHDLTTDEGLQQLVTETGGPRGFYGNLQRLEGIRAVVQDAIQRHPNIAQTKVRVLPNLPNAFYNFDRGEILLGLVEPVGLAHELEHADSVRQEGLYRNVLRAAQGISRINNIVALPTVLALRVFLHDRDRRDDILKTLSAVSAAAAAPVLLEEGQASLRTLQHYPNKREALRTLGPAFLAHLGANVSPIITYQMGRS
jgi:hypothetical protein